jgi:chromosome partitioning protein
MDQEHTSDAIATATPPPPEVLQSQEAEAAVDPANREVEVRIVQKVPPAPEEKTGSDPVLVNAVEESTEAQADQPSPAEPVATDPFLDELPDDLPPRYLAFLNQKGGVGKTTTTVNLGAAVATFGKRVLLIDLDPQAHLTLHLGIEPGSLERTLYDLMTDDETGAMEIVQEIKPNLFVLPAEVNLAGVESELAADMMTGRAQRVLRDKCKSLLDAQPFDFIMIDCPPSLGLLAINALTLANEVVVPMQAHFLALQGLSKLLETVHLVRQGFNPSLSVAGIVLCMHERQTLLAAEIQNDLTAFLESARGTDQPWANAEVFTPPIRRNIKLAESPSFGQSIFDYAPDCHGADDYRKLAKSLLMQPVRFQ